MLFVFGAAWTVMPVLFGGIMKSTGMTLKELLVVWGMMPLAVAVFAVPGGLLGDRYGIRWSIGLGIIFAAVFSALRGVSNTFYMMLLMMLLFGVAVCPVIATVPKALREWFPLHRLGLANGIVQSCYGLGAGLALTFGGAVLMPALGGWQNVIFLLSAICGVLGLLWIFTIHAPPKKEEEAVPTIGMVLGAFKYVLTIPSVWCIFFAQFFWVGGYILLIGYAPTYFAEIQKIEVHLAHLAPALGLYAYVVGAIVVPWISDRIGLRKVVYVPLGIVAGIIVACTAWLFPPALLWANVLLGLLGGIAPLLFAVPTEIEGVGAALAGAVVGLVVAGGNLGGFLFSTFLAPALIALPNPKIYIIVAGVFYACSSIAFVFIKETGWRAKKAAA
jgi:MFS family permease